MTLHMPHPHMPHPHMPHPVTAVTHWREHHPKHVKSDWDVHLHPHHQALHRECGDGADDGPPVVRRRPAPRAAPTTPSRTRATPAISE